MGVALAFAFPIASLAMRPLKVRQRLGKYRIERRIGQGTYAAVYRALDTVEGIRVALKVPHAEFTTPDALDEFRREVKLVARLDHPNILPIKNADFIDGRFVIANPLGLETLGERLRRRYRLETALDWTEQLLHGVAYAHEEGVVHCDIKPDNLILFEDGRLRLADFGIAKVAQHRTTMTGGGTGTIGYLAPEQAFGRPSLRSDVFSIGLILYRLFGRELPTWPYAWPGPGYASLRRAVSPTMMALIQRSMEVDDRKRFPDARRMLATFERVKPHALRRPRNRRRTAVESGTWKSARVREFQRRYGRELGTRFQCTRCHNPVSETMQWCPWCGLPRKHQKHPTRFPARCKRCGRGIKRDWPFCAWCYGGRVQEPSAREYDDARYTARCSNPRCTRRQLMPFMKYCPWCRAKVTRKWPVSDGGRCRRCRWGIATEYWSWCPWCGRKGG